MMKNKNCFDDKYVLEAYDRWIKDPYVFSGNYHARERFYDFVISCVSYVKCQVRFITKDEAWKSINMDTLREHLEEDLAKLKKTNCDLYYDRLHEILVSFENLIRYEKRRYQKGLR